jgi:hypothetical protein
MHLCIPYGKHADLSPCPDPFVGAVAPDSPLPLAKIFFRGVEGAAPYIFLVGGRSTSHQRSPCAKGAGFCKAKDWGIVIFQLLTIPPTSLSLGHLPLHKKGLEKIATQSGGDFIVSN